MHAEEPAERPHTSASFQAAFLVGAGLMAAMDEIVFHQLLGWHHFYDRATPALGLASDGLLHAAELIAIVAGSFRVADLLGRRALVRPWAWAGLFLGAGLFQLLDGVVNHKVLRLHQVRYGVYIVPYDVAWNAAGAVLILIGAFWLRRARRTAFDNARPIR